MAMQLFNNLKMLYKIMALVVIIAVFLAGVGAIGYYYANDLSDRLSNMYYDNLLKVKRLNETRANFRAVHAMIMEMILGNVSKAEEQQLMGTIKGLSEETNQTVTDYKKSALTSFEEQKIADLDKAIAAYREARQKALEMAQSGNKQEAYAYFSQNAVGHLKKVNDILAELSNYNTKASEEANQRGEKGAAIARGMILGVTAVAVLILAALGWFIAGMTARRLGNVVSTLKEVAGGDLTADVTVTATDEIGALGITLNDMTHNLRDLVSRVAQLGEQVAAASEQLTASAGDAAQATNQVAANISEVSHGTEIQITAVNETSAVVEQMSSGIRQVAANSNAVAEMTAQTANAARSGEVAVNSAVSQMANIERSVNSSAQVVTKLGARSQEIGQIVDTISGIAGQTNLLALNAAIEAARAGEQGRGFAVVAEEVRKLAEQSQEAAKQIAGLISEIQSDTDKAVAAMAEGTREVKAGTEVVAVTGQTFGEIMASINQVSGQVGEISAAIQQMAGGSQKIVESVRDIDKVTKDTAGQAQTVSAATEEQSAAMEEIAASSQSLSQMAQELQNAIQKFKV